MATKTEAAETTPEGSSSGTDRSLWQRLLAVQMAVDHIAKASRNKQQSYDYASSSDVLNELREAINAQGLLLEVHVLKAKVNLGVIYPHAPKGAHHLTELWLKFVWVNADDQGQRIEVPYYAQGADDAEKGVGKALTYGEKFFLLKWFHIPTDKQDAERDTEGGNGNGHAQAADPPPAAKPAAGMDLTPAQRIMAFCKQHQITDEQRKEIGQEAKLKGKLPEQLTTADAAVFEKEGRKFLGLEEPAPQTEEEPTHA